MGSRFERMIGHIGTETRSKLLREKGKRCRVPISPALMVPSEEAPANSVPAAAVIRRVQALIGITGRKAHVGCPVSQG